jgi:hypothetical protein
MRSLLDSLRVVQNWVGARGIPLVGANHLWHPTMYLHWHVQYCFAHNFLKTLGAKTKHSPTLPSPFPYTRTTW